MTFYTDEIDVCPTYGWQGGPTASVIIKTLKNRHEKRNRDGDLLQHRYILPFQNIDSLAYFAEIKAAFMAYGGPADSFLAKDWWDNKVEDGPLGLAPSGMTPVQLVRVYPKGSASYTRVITKPVAGVVIRQNGLVIEGSINKLTGLFIPDTNWTEGAILTADFEFRVPVRFETFALEPSIDNRFSNGEYAMNGSCTLIEVFGE